MYRVPIRSQNLRLPALGATQFAALQLHLLLGCAALHNRWTQGLAPDFPVLTPNLTDKKSLGAVLADH